MRSELSANATTALVQAVPAGGGLALQTSSLANPHMADSGLVAVLPDWQAPDISIYALHPSSKHLSPALCAVVDVLVQRFAAPSW